MLAPLKDTELYRRWLRPGWPDEARRLSQGPVLRAILGAEGFAGRVLNAGCGEGLYAPLLESFPSVGRIIHFDLARPRTIRRRPDPRGVFLSASITHMPFPDAAFDACLCSEVLEHVASDAAAAAELARVLRPGGRLLVSVPTPPAPHDPNHVREGYTFAELRALLGAAGFEVVDHAYAMRLFLRALMWMWRGQEALLRGRPGSIIPVAVIRSMGVLDSLAPIGAPWDLVALAVRSGGAR
jgi:SAM-dependent methyltransferase